jgi:hypothetical protein
MLIPSTFQKRLQSAEDRLLAVVSRTPHANLLDSGFVDLLLRDTPLDERVRAIAILRKSIGPNGWIDPYRVTASERSFIRGVNLGAKR